MQRRSFIKIGCIACMGLASGLSLEGCAPIPIQKPKLEDKTFKIEKSKLLGKDLCILQNLSLPFDVLLVRTAQGFDALRMQCTHQQQPLVATAKGLYCNAHGSSFNLQGKPIKEPAINPLHHYTVRETDTHWEVLLNS